jgi:hypothetical protein
MAKVILTIPHSNCLLHALDDHDVNDPRHPDLP